MQFGNGKFSQPLSCQCDERSADPSEGALLLQEAEAVSPGSEHEQHEGKQHNDAGDSEPKAPADVVLDVAEDDEGDHDAAANSEVPPVEEGAPGDAFLGVVLVELVRAEGLDAGLVASLGDCHQVEGDVEQGHLEPRRWASRSTFRRMEDT